MPLPEILIRPGESKTIGRGARAQVAIDDASPSRVHARVVGLSEAARETVRRAGMLHDIGKVGVLDAAERAVMQSHALIGYDMLCDLPFLQEALPAIRGHHERWDGDGYPDRLSGAAIHQHARLMAVADSFDAMTSARPYRAALPLDEAARRLRAGKGSQFEPAAIDAFDAVEKDLVALHARGSA